MLINTICNTTCGILFSLLILIFNNDIIKPKINIHNLILLIISVITFSAILFIEIELFIVQAFVIFALTLIINYLFNNYAINISIVKSIILYLSLTICYNFALLITCISYSINSTIFCLTYTFLLFILVIVSYYILKKNNNFFEKIKLCSKRTIICTILVLLLSLIPTFYSLYAPNYNVLSLKITLYYLIIISSILLYIIITDINSNIYQVKYNKLKTDNKAMSNLIDGARTIKHDYSNIFQIINGYLCSRDYEKLNNYVNSIMREFNILNNISLLNTSIFDEPGIYGIVGSKQFLANEKGILFDIDVTSKVSDIHFNTSKLCRMFGILLDNAIEATLKSKNKYIKLEIHFDIKKNAHVIKIYNTYNNKENIDLTKIYDKGYSSKKVKSGIGLWEVKRMINSYNNSQIYATIEDEFFIQNIIIES